MVGLHGGSSTYAACSCYTVKVTVLMVMSVGNLDMMVLVITK